MPLSQAEATQALLNCFPRGYDRFLDFETGDVGRLIFAFASVLKSFGYDPTDLLRLELCPATMGQKIPDWEGALGLLTTTTAQAGSALQRRNQVLGWLRSLGDGFSLPGLQAIFELFLQYQDASQIEIVEADHAALLSAHTYPSGAINLANALGVIFSSVTVADDPRVSPAGAQVGVTVTGNLSDLGFSLSGPEGLIKVWPVGFLGSGAVVAEVHRLACREAAGKRINGPWTLGFSNDGAGGGATLVSWALTVEGLGRNPDKTEGLGAAHFDWAVVADPALLSASADLQAARRILSIVKPAHTLGHLVLKNTVGGGGLLAIPDDPATLPDGSIPG